MSEVEARYERLRGRVAEADQQIKILDKYRELELLDKDNGYAGYFNVYAGCLPDEAQPELFEVLKEALEKWKAGKIDAVQAKLEEILK